MKVTVKFLIVTLVILSTACSPVIKPSSQPNIIFILTDDLDAASMAYMPKTNALLATEGASFTNYFDSMPLCCPSRSTILRGQYPHNTQILGNRPPEGGYEKFYELGNEKSTLAVWLQEAGYRTALFGKYLNGYPGPVDKTLLPPGWTEWFSPVEGNAYTEYNYTLNENGRLVQYGEQPQDYGTDVYSAKAIDFIRRAIQDKQPFFAYISVYAPHSPSTPATRHADLFQEVRLPRTASFNEEDLSDKPQALREIQPLTNRQIKNLEKQYRLRLQSLQAVDEMIEKLVQELESQGQLENTYIFFTSDNGFHMGQHRMGAGKNTPYEEDIRVPLYVRGPGISGGKTIDELAGNVDLAPTFAELTGAKMPDFVDGRSVVDLLKGNSQSATNWRQAFLLEKGLSSDEEVEEGGILFTQAALEDEMIDFSGLLEPPDSIFYDQVTQRRLGGGVWRGIRTAEYTYVEYDSGEVELYDLAKDPDQLQNISGTAAESLLKQLHNQLESLRDCSAQTCREADKLTFDWMTGFQLFAEFLRYNFGFQL